jgi:hypothetical protein
VFARALRSLLSAVAPSLKDALISFYRQDDYLIPFHRFAVGFRLVQGYVQKRDQMTSPVNKFQGSNYLHFALSTGLPGAIAPIVCVDVFHFSVKVNCVDGRKGRHNKTSRSE